MITLSGAGAAHQNGVAKRAIKMVVSIACTMMLHAAMRSPEGTITTELWPMAMDHAVWIYNHIPKADTGLSPMQHWMQSTFKDTKMTLNNLHVWGCPTYVLEPKLQKPGVKIPKWAPRSQQGRFMGFSRFHSTLIGLILNPRTGSISPQFHVVYDDVFSTVHSSQDLQASEQWNKLFTSSSARICVFLDQTDDPELSEEWLTTEEQQAHQLWE